jgi:hypothetical protein
MPTAKRPRSNLKLLAFLQRALTTGRQDRDQGQPLLDDATLQAIETFLADWEPKVGQLSPLLAARSQATRRSERAVRELETYVRDVRAVQKRRIARQRLPAGVYRYYGMELDGSSPRAGARQQWIVWAQQLVAGDDDAVAAGYAPSSNPSAAEVADKLALAQAELDEVALADRAYDQAQEAVAEGRARAKELTREVMAQLRFNLRRQTPESQRRVMRSYGAQFGPTPGEPVELE